MTRYDYHKPTTLKEAFALADELPGASYVAGGTDLMVGIKNNHVRPPALISLRSIDELGGIEVGDRVRLGPLTTIAEVLEHEELGRRLPLLIEAARRLGSTQIRNAGTVGGNLCNASPCADAACALLALEASVRLERGGDAREVGLDEFFTGPKETCLAPGEILTEVLVDPPAAGTRHAFFKRGRVRLDMAIASLALLVELDGRVCRRARLAAGSVAPTPLRLSAVEQLLDGAELTDERIAEARRLAEESVAPIDDIRSTAEFRRNIIGVWTERALRETTSEVAP
jgi:carbon-monoxide dehydrogenase medium subunit